MLVAVAEIESAVKKVMREERVTMMMVWVRPTLPTTQPARRYMTTPRMVRMLGV